MFLSPVNQLCSTSEEAVFCFSSNQPLSPPPVYIWSLFNMTNDSKMWGKVTTTHSWGVWHLHSATAKLQKVLKSLVVLQRAPTAQDGFDQSNRLCSSADGKWGVLCFWGGNGIWGNRLQRRQEIKSVLKGSAVLMTWGIMSCNMGRGKCLRQFFLMAPHCIYASNFPCCTFQQSSWWC